MNYKNTYMILNLNREEVRAEIPSLDFTIARRVKGPIYDVLINELYEHGCTVSAKYFRCLSEKEDDLYKHGTIRHRIRSNSNLLYQIFDYCIAAEKAYSFRDCKGLTNSFENMCRLLMIIEEQGINFQWLLSDIYEIVMKIIRHVKPNEQPQKIIARLYYMYGLRLSQSQDDLAKSIEYLRKALELSRGQKWSANEPDEFEDTHTLDVKATAETAINTLHEETVRSLSRATVKYARLIGKKYTKYAAELAKEAMVLVAEVGIHSNKYDFYNCFITCAEHLAESSNHNDAVKLLNKFNMYFKPEDTKQFGRLYCKQHIIRGDCNASLNNIQQAIRDYGKAIEIARYAKYKDLEAHGLVHIAIIFGLNKMDTAKSKIHYENARKIFLELGDRQNETKTHYLLAKLRADEMFPSFCDILKQSGSLPCNIYKLRRWKNNCEPFWIGWGNYLTRVTEEPLCCLLEDDASVATLKSYQSQHLGQNRQTRQHSHYKASAIAMTEAIAIRKSSTYPLKVKTSSTYPLKGKTSSTYPLKVKTSSTYPLKVKTSRA